MAGEIGNFKNPIDKQQAITQVLVKKQRAQAGGNVDYEKDRFDEIVQKIKDGAITPEKGVLEAESIENRRNER
jgi:hypothetical protein